MHSLPLFHRIKGRRVVIVGDDDAAEAKARLVERAGGIPCPETEAHQATLGFVAIEDRRQAESAALRLKRAGLLVNVADRPDLCDFTLPSVLDRDPVLIAVSTGGASAGLAKHLRLRLEAILPENIGRLAEGLFAMRDKLRVRFPSANDRRRVLDEALSKDGPLDPLNESSAETIGDWLDATPTLPTDRTIEFTLTSDDPDDLTLRQARTLGIADTVLHDPAVDEAILVRARADAIRLPLGSELPSEGLTVILKRA